MGTEDSLIIVMPAFNEEENIEGVVRSWYKILSDKAESSELVVNISGSNDSTEKILMQMQAELPKLHVIDDSENTYRDKLLDLYKYALASEIDYIFQTDSDGQTNPEEFAGFWACRNQYDSVIGFRKHRGDGIARSIVEGIVCILIALLCRVKVPDANAPFRLMKKDFLSEAMGLIPLEYSMPSIMLTIFGAKKKNILFREISFMPRIKGKNKMNAKKIIRTGLESVQAFTYFSGKIKS